MNTNEQYVPDEEQVRAWCREGTGDYPDVMDEWLDRFLARVRREAKAEALREAADHIEEVVVNARPEQAFTEHVLMEHGGPGYLRELAAEHEAGDQA